MNNLQKKLTPLEVFALAVLKEYSDSGYSDLDGCWIQDKAVEWGLMDAVKVTESCGEDCICEDFPMTCLRFKPEVWENIRTIEP